MNKSVLALPVLLFVLFLAASRCAAAGDLENQFRSPPKSARPWTYWMWMQDSATKESITHDLEAMADHGIGGVLLFTVGGGQSLTKPPVPSLTPIWWDHIDHALREADRLGIDIRLNACDGWATAGSPAITPELSMQQLTSASVIVEGGQPFTAPLPQPPKILNYYRDIALLAYPEPVANARTSVEAKPKVTTSKPGLNADSLVAGSPRGLALPVPGWVQYEFSSPFTCRAITVYPVRHSYQVMRMEVQSSDDGTNFHSLGRLVVPRHGFQDGSSAMTTAVAPTAAKFFRFVCDPAGGEPAAEDMDSAKDRSKNGSTLTQLVLSENASLSDWEGKSGLFWRRGPSSTAEQIPDSVAVPQSSIINLTDKMSADGKLDWTPPAGHRWVLLRVGHTSTGRKNGPAGGGIGLEADKLDPASVPAFFNAWYGKALEHQAKLGTKSLIGSHVDSWECYSQNWSPIMLAEFKRRRGYDPTPYLPAMTGVVVDSAEVSERFLSDVRQTISELVVDSFFTPLQTLLHDHNANLSAECVAPTMMCDGMAHYSHTDVPMGEFWYESSSGDKPNDVLDAINGARIYGKQIVQTESFTYRDIDWSDSPFEMKTMGDHNFALGVNRFVLHTWALKATPGSPGVNLWQYGSDYSDRQTWWKPAKAWFQYLARCEAMLQTGVPVVDFLYYVGENQPTRALTRSRLNPALPDGYAYGSINRDALLHIAKAENSHIALPNGMSYRVLILPPDDRMSPEVARVIADFSKAGVPILGTKPTRSISLSDYPHCDEEVRQIVADGWTNVRGQGDLATVLGDPKLPADLIFPGVDQSYVWREKLQYASSPISWAHRRDGDSDFYFISNQEYQPRSAEAVFNIAGKQPELWDPATGSMRELADWSVKEGRTSIPLQFNPAESFFIVFRHPASPPATTAANFPTFEVRETLQQPWQVTFEANHGAPESTTLASLASLHTNADEGIKHFSGTATYHCEFKAPQLAAGSHVFLDLGRIANLADVTLNGHPVGIVWKPPYRLDITDALSADNKLDVAVSSTWRNRMLADAKLLENERVTHAPLYKWEILKDKPLVESGLLGPVTLQVPVDHAAH